MPIRTIAVLLLLISGGCTKAKSDLVAAADLSTPSGASADLATQASTDLASNDMTAFIDLSQTKSSDMAQTLGADMTVACGSEAGIACCPGTGVPAYCADRGSVSGWTLVCHAGTCAECGGQMQLCCDNNMCAGGLVCAGPASANYGYCG